MREARTSRSCGTMGSSRNYWLPGRGLMQMVPTPEDSFLDLGAAREMPYRLQHPPFLARLFSQHGSVRKGRWAPYGAQIIQAARSLTATSHPGIRRWPRNSELSHFVL